LFGGTEIDERLVLVHWQLLPLTDRKRVADLIGRIVKKRGKQIHE
jgi:hypothetical protein